MKSGSQNPVDSGIAQGTSAWFEARRGKITASRAAACLGLGFDSPAEAWRQITGRSPLQAPNEAMRRGLAWEETSRRRYEKMARSSGSLLPWETVQPGGFWVHPNFPWLAASPDGLVGQAGLLELKNPWKLATEVAIPYRIQCIIQMACTGRAWCDFFSWPPGNANHYWERISRPSETALASFLARLGAWHEKHIIGDRCPPDGRSNAGRAQARASIEQCVKWGLLRKEG